MKVEKIIKIIESCETFIHFQNTKDIIDEITFDSKEQCEQVKAAIIKKENQFNKHIL